MNFLVETGHWGPRVVLTSQWDARVAEYMRRELIDELELNYARGWVVEPITFLADVPALRGLTIIAPTLEDDGPLFQLTRLAILHVSTGAKNPVDLSQLRDLREFTGDWRAGSESLVAATRLSRLHLSGFPYEGTDFFASFNVLSKLTLASGPIADLAGVGRMASLRSLGLYNLKRLRTLDGLEGISTLEELLIEDCRHLTEVSALAHHSGLKRLSLSNCGRLVSMSIVSHMTGLESLEFWGSTTIADGDLSPLLGLPRLQNVRFQNRRHYSHRREIFPPWNQEGSTMPNG